MGKVGSRGPGGGDVVPFPGGRERAAMAPQKPLSALVLEVPLPWLETEPPPREWLLSIASTGAGVVPMGRVGLLAARGGTGKSYALTQLAVAVASGTTWLGEGVGWATRQGRVLLVLAEEDRDEVQRRLYWSCRAVGLGSIQRAVVAGAVTVLAGAGVGLALTSALDFASGELPETARAEELRAVLRAAKAEERPYTLVVLDPLQRLAGPDIEADPSVATRWVQVAETLTAPECGSPAVIVAHHGRKGVGGSRGEGDAMDAVRGTTGLPDAMRYTLLLSRLPVYEGAPKLMRLALAKTNYAPETELMLTREENGPGALRVATEEEQTAYKEAAAAARRKPGAAARAPKPSFEEQQAEVLAEIRRAPGSGRLIATRLGRRVEDVRVAIEALRDAGKTRRVGGRNGSWVAVDGPPAVPDDEPEDPQGSLM